MNTQLLATEDSLNSLILNQVMEDMLLLAQESLRVFASQPDFWSKMQFAFGEDFDWLLARNLKQDWNENYFFIKPVLVIRSAEEMNGALGAFAQSTNSIYLSREFLTQNRENPEVIARIWLEEFGHFVDSLINEEDSRGDEGAIFATLVEDGGLDGLKLQRLKAEDDRATITLDGKVVQIEQANISWIGGSGDWYDSANWSNNQLPQANDDVIIESSGAEITITFSQGAPTVNSLNLYARNSGILRLPDLTNYGGNDNVVVASGTGSRIDLSKIVTLNGGDGIQFYVEEGGKIDLNSVPSISTGARVLVEAQDPDSVVNLSSLTSFTDTSGSSLLEVSNGGTIIAGNLTTLDGVALSIFDNNSTLNTNQISSFTNALIRVEGTTIDLSGLNNIDSIDFSVEEGGSLDLTHITSYTGKDNVVVASGTDSRIDLSEIVTLNGGDGIQFYVEEGGKIDLSSVPSISTGARVLVDAQDPDSVVNLSSLTSFTDTSGSSLLEVSNGGTIIADNLTTLEKINLFSYNSNFSLPKLTNYLGDNFVRASDGGRISLNRLSEITDGILEVLADGSESLVELSADIFEEPFLPEERNGGQILVGGQTLDQLPFTTITTENLLANTTWNQLVKVFTDVTIPENVTLTVEPGTNIKFYDDSIGIDVYGKLEVQGTLDEPVIITHWLDDGSDSNNSTLIPGIWEGITFSGENATGNLEGVSIRYADQAIYGEEGATINLSNAVLTDNNWGIYVYSPFVEITAENALIANNEFNGIFQRADSRGVYRNLTIANNGYAGSDWTAAGVHLGGANLTLENSIVAFNSNGLDHSGDPPLTNVNHSIFYNPDGEEIIWETGDSGEPDLSQDGNIIANPLFINREAANYQLFGGSPAIDAGRGTDAPTQDLLGEVRYDDLGIANSGEGTPDYVDIGAYEYQGFSRTSDLAVVSIANPAPNSLSAGEEFTTSYTVTNLSQTDDAATGNWVDRIYLSGDRYLSPDDILLQTIEQSQSLAFGQSYSENLNLTVPTTAGPKYLLVLVDAERTIAEAKEINNFGIASQCLSVEVPLLTVGNSVSGQVQQGEWAFIQLAGESGKTVRLNLDGADASGTLALYTQYGTIPNALEYQDRAALNQPDQEIRIINPRAGTYYIGVYGQWVSGGTTNFTVSAELTEPALYSVTQTEVDNSGQATLELLGDNFSATDTIKLVAPDGISELIPVSVFNQDSTRAYATFNFTGADLGAYDVIVEIPDAPQPLVLLDALTVTTARDSGEHNFFADLFVPDYVRPGREVNLTVTSGNSTNADLSSPLLILESNQELEWQLPSTQDWITGSSIQFLALSDDGAANILRPGDNNSVEIKIRTPFDTGEINYTLLGIGISDNDGSTGTIDWDNIEAASRPPEISSEAWDKIWNNVEVQTGNTWQDLINTLGDNAAYLAKLGQPVNEVGQLFAFEMSQALGLNFSTYLAGNQDAFVSASGLDLNFNRVYFQSLISRSELGALGRGWSHNYEINLEEIDTNNIVAHGFAPLPRLFTRNDSGNYEGVTKDEGLLISNQDGTFTLRQPDGTVYNFLTDLRLDSIVDSNSNTISASYTNDLLTQLTHSSGQSLQLEYDANNRLSRLIDQAGRETIYEYDPSGERLIRVTSADNQVTDYEYSPSDGSLASVTNILGEKLAYNYDSQGRLTGIDVNNGVATTNYSYDSAGTVTVSDATGATTNLYYDWRGLPIQVTDALGRTYQFSFDSDGNVTQLQRPDGLTIEITYDDFGKPVLIRDPLGNNIGLKYDSTFNNLQWLQDGRGNTIYYDYDAAGNLTSTTYADGSAETFMVDAFGNRQKYTNRRGNSIDYTYTNAGLLATQANPDGSSLAYSYDNRGNLISANDSTGVTTLEYDSSDRLIKITYPTGRYLEYSYDTMGRRTRIGDGNGFTVNYSYDNAGRLAGLSDGNNNPIVTYSYDSADRLLREDNGNGTYTTYEYDLAGQILAIANYDANDTINSRFDYSYDNLGRRTSMNTLEGTTQYSYDANGQLISITLPHGRTIDYKYDAAGNRITVTDNGVATAYATDNLNHYTTVGNATYTYDADGNLITKIEDGDTSTYGYNDENRLVSAVTPDGTWTYEYDALGNRIASNHNGDRTEYLLDPTGMVDVVAEYEGNGNLIAYYTQGIGLVSRVDATNTVTYYDSDAIGSIVGLTDANGAYLNQYSYLPFGEHLTKVETVANPFEYVGQWGVMDEENDLDFMRARFYDPSLGRFVSEDPLGITANNFNLVNYAGNNPLNYIDPSGYQQTGGERIEELQDFQAKFDKETWYQKYGQVKGYVDLYNKFSNLRDASKRGNQIDIARKGIDLVSGWSGSALPFSSPPIAGSYEPINNASNPLNFATYLLNKIIDWYESAINALQGLSNSTDENNVLDRESSSNIASLTPEDKFGLAGYDNPDTPENEGYIIGNQPLEYRIDFWNKPDATVPTQVAIIKDTLDPNLDWDTLNFTNVGFLKWNQDIPGGQTIDTRIDMRPDENLAVDVTATFNPETGEIVWTFETVDPITGDPNDVEPFAGFLPPFNEETQYELGWVEFTVEPKDDLPTGTQIQNQAFVQFDLVNPFNPAPKEGPWTNTIDADVPASNVNPLPATVTSEFTVSWTGEDVGSGIASYDIYVSEDSEPFNLWLDDINETEAIFTGEIDHTYRFFSVASDNVGHTEEFPDENNTTRIVTTTTTDTLLENPFYRFQNTALPGTYLFAGEEESISIRQNFMPPFVEEGLAFYASSEPHDDLIRMNRFQNQDVPGTYLFAGEEESVSIRANYPNFIEEGIAFYVYGADADQGVDFYRFQNTAQPGTYIFVGEEEKNNILRDFPQFILEGNAFEVAV